MVLDHSRNKNSLVQLVELEECWINELKTNNEKIHIYKGVGIQVRSDVKFSHEAGMTFERCRYTADLPLSSTRNPTNFGFWQQTATSSLRVGNW